MRERVAMMKKIENWEVTSAPVWFSPVGGQCVSGLSTTLIIYNKKAPLGRVLCQLLDCLRFEVSAFTLVIDSELDEVGFFV